MARDSELYRHWKEAVTQSLDYLDGQAKNGKGPDEVITQEVVFDERNFPRIRFVQKRLLDFFIRRNIDGIEKLSAVRSLLGHMQGSTLIREHYKSSTIKNEPDLQPYLMTGLVITFLHKYAETEFFPEFDQAKFDKIYAEVESYLSGELVRHYYAPMPGFSMDAERLELYNNVVIRRITPREFNRTLGMGQIPEFSLSGLIPPNEVYWSPFVIEATFKQSEKVESRFIDLIDALRLFKSGQVGISGVFREPEIEWGIGFTAVILPDRKFRLFGGRYRLEGNEITSFKIFYENFSKVLPKVKQLEFLDLAIRRFVVATEENLSEDKVIDFMIALESLYSTETQELAYRFALRLASLLGTSDKEREYLFEFAKKGYGDARSKLVHGESYKKPIDINGKKFTIDELANELEKLTRLSLRNFLNLISSYYHDKEGIIKDLDRSLLSVTVRNEIIARAKGAFD